jgi:hypothetical protein
MFLPICMKANALNQKVPHHQRGRVNHKSIRRRLTETTARQAEAELVSASDLSYLLLNLLKEEFKAYDWTNVKKADGTPLLPLENPSKREFLYTDKYLLDMLSQSSTPIHWYVYTCLIPFP